MTKKARAAKARRESKKWHGISAGIGILAFIQQLVSKDMNAINSQGSWMAKGQTIANVLTGRIFGFNFFNSAPQYQQTINPAGMANKWTALGIFGTFFYHMIPKAPEKGKARIIGRNLLIAGLLGGLFDAPTGSTASRSLGYGSGARGQIPSGTSANRQQVNPGNF